MTRRPHTTRPGGTTRLVNGAVSMSLPFFWRSENHTSFCSIFQSTSLRISPRTLVVMQYELRAGCRHWNLHDPMQMMIRTDFLYKSAQFMEIREEPVTKSWRLVWPHSWQCHMPVALLLIKLLLVDTILAVDVSLICIQNTSIVLQLLLWEHHPIWASSRTCS